MGMEEGGKRNEMKKNRKKKEKKRKKGGTWWQVKDVVLNVWVGAISCHTWVSLLSSSPTGNT